jgi:ankyrin repeat protein
MKKETGFTKMFRKIKSFKYRLTPLVEWSRRFGTTKQKEKDAFLINISKTGHFEDVNRILKHGANPNAKDEEGKTALMNAVGGKHYRISKFLIEHGANPNLADKTNGVTALMIAAAKDLELTKLLVDNKADMFAKDAEGMIPYMYAYFLNKKDICEFLRSRMIK